MVVSASCTRSCKSGEAAAADAPITVGNPVPDLVGCKMSCFLRAGSGDRRAGDRRNQLCELPMPQEAGIGQ
jgi:hypothetical protein